MGLFRSLFNNKTQVVKQEKITYPHSLISRTKILEGRYVHSIINNGGSCFLIDLAVFEDGVINCWGNVDLELLKYKISSGWLSPTVPTKQRISKHHLAGWEIESAKWYYTKENYYDFLLSVVKSMNPNFTNLFHSNGQDSKVIGNTNYSAFTYSSEQLLRKDDESLSFKEFKGKREHYLFKKSEGVYWLCNFNIYSDNSILIDGMDAPSIKFENKLAFENLIENGTVATKIPDHSTIIIKDVGEIKIAKTLYSVDVTEKYVEIDDIINRLNGTPTTSDECVKIYQEYNKNSTPENKQKLKNAYERIPKHLRLYVLGDMDVKDGPIRAIIYEEE